MPRNFNIETIYNKQCFGCHKVIWWQDFKHIYTDGPDADSQKHSCYPSQPKGPNKQDIIILKLDNLDKKLDKHFSLLREMKLKTDSLMVTEERVERGE